MELNVDIYKNEITTDAGIGASYKATAMLQNMLDDGWLQYNVPIDETIFYAVDMNPLDDYFIRRGNRLSHASEWVEGPHTASGICAMINASFFNIDVSNGDSVRPIWGLPNFIDSRIAYDSTGAGIGMSARFLTEYTVTDWLFVVKVIAYAFIYNGEGSVTGWDDRIDVDVKTFNEQYKNTHHVVGIYVQPYAHSYYANERRPIYGLWITPFYTYNPDTLRPTNYKIYGSLPSTDYASEHPLLNTFMYGMNDINTSYFNSYNYIYANLGRISLWEKIQFYPGSNYTYNGDLPVFKFSLDHIHQLYSHMGMFYTFDENIARTAKLTDTGIFGGTIDSTGKVTGKITEGSDNANTPQYKWNTPTKWQETPFNGIENTDPNNYTDKIELSKPNLSTINSFNRTFAINANTVKNLADFLWNADETKFDEIIHGLGLMGENPIDGLIDLRMYPFNVAAKNNATVAEPIVVGRTDTGVSGIKLTENVNAIIDLGSCSFFPKFKNFLDFEPYTTAQLYIPYVGVVPVSTAEFMGHTISCKMIVDYTTGACTAVVYKDDIPYIYRNGSVAVEIPMTATNSARVAQTAINNAIGAVTNTGNAVGSFASGNIAGGIGSTVGTVKNVYDTFTQPTQYQTAGASTANCATWQPQNCYFIITRPILNTPSNYGHTVGYACEQSGTLGNFSGFTVVSNPDINFKCTDTEKSMLISALQNGVYV